MTVSLDTSSSPTLHDPVSLLDYFTELADPRREQGRIHRLDEIIFISICAVTCGADSWEEIAELRPLQDGLAPDRPHLARRHPLARHLPTCLLPARPAGLSRSVSTPG